MASCHNNCLGKIGSRVKDGGEIYCAKSGIKNRRSGEAKKGKREERKDFIWFSLGTAPPLFRRRRSGFLGCGKRTNSEESLGTEQKKREPFSRKMAFFTRKLP